MKKFCQSCAMPLDLHGQDQRGSEADGSLSEEYCKYCYENGQFTEPDITFEAMLEKGRQAISEGEGNALSKWLMRMTYPMMLKKASRWKK